MNITFSKKLSAAFLAITLAGSAFAQVIDFQSLEAANNSINYHGYTYSEDGFTLDNLGSLEFGTFGTMESRYPGSTALFNDTVAGLTRLTKTGGGLFALNAIDLTELNGPYVSSVTFNAYSGVTLLGSQTFTLDGNSFAPETFTFNSLFASVDRVEWSQDFPYHQFDNIVLNAESTPNNSVPDSGSTLAFLGLALAAGAWLRRLIRV